MQVKRKCKKKKKKTPESTTKVGQNDMLKPLKQSQKNDGKSIWKIIYGRPVWPIGDGGGGRRHPRTCDAC